MLSKRNCLNISRASTNLKAVPQDVTYSCCTSICLATCLAIIVITTVRVQVLRNIDIYIEALSKAMKYVIKTKLPQYI